MQDPFVVFVISLICILIFVLILYQIEAIWNPYAKIKCHFNRHTRVENRFGAITNHYRCIYCGKPKSHPHLKVLQGGKKTVDNTFKF